MGFVDFLEQLFPAQLELLVGREFRDQVVVVAIEPLGQLLCVAATAAAVADAPCHGEQGFQARLAAVRTEALGDHAEGQRVGEYLVVPGEIADRQQVETGVLLQLPVGGTQLAANRLQAGLIQLSLPVSLQGLLQFAVGTDTRETQGMGQGHVETLHR
ncbi:hypothetical protein D3C84_730440 [compost metagenome]